MKLPPLFSGAILSRYKRFFAEVRLESGELVTAHCPNTGAMTSCWQPGAPAQLSASQNPKRKLKWTLERIDMGAGWIGVNTNRVNHIVANFIQNHQIDSFEGYSDIKSEPAYSPAGFDRSRFDLRLQGDGHPDCFIEIKNTTLFRDGYIEFPDAVTKRGYKHLQLLRHAVNQGFRGVIFYAVNRPEGETFRIASDIDPNYYQALVDAKDSGVEIIAQRIVHTDDGVEAGPLLPVLLK